MSSDTMRVRLVSIGFPKAILPQQGRPWNLATDESVSALLAQLRKPGQVKEVVLQTAAVAVNQEGMNPDLLLKNGEEVAGTCR